MVLPNELTTALLLLALIGILRLVYYTYNWRKELRELKRKLELLQEKMRHQPQANSAKHHSKETPCPRPIFIEMESLNDVSKIRHYAVSCFPDFVSALAAYRKEKLTASDELLCMMIKLEYSNKEIASVLSITTNSVITARYRLKRKLSLPPDCQLDEWIATLGQEANHIP